MKVIISVGELLAKGKLELAQDVVPGFNPSMLPQDLAKEVELNETQAARLGLVVVGVGMEGI